MPRLRSFICGLGALVCVPALLTAHEYPIAIGSASDENGDVVAVLTTRGFFVRRDGSDTFKLQCLEYSQMLSTDTPAFVVASGRLYASTVEGVVSYGLDGCDRTVAADLAGIATLDITHRQGEGFRVLTSQAGFANDVYSSPDGLTWTPLGLSFEGGFLTRFRHFGDESIASGLRVDTTVGAVVHFVRTYAADASFREYGVEFDDETFRVVVVDVNAEENAALVLVDRYTEATQPDAIYRFADGELTLVAERFQVADARFDGDSVLVAHINGFDRVTSNAETQRIIEGVRVSGLSTSNGRAFVSLEYAIDQFALGELVGDELEPLLWYHDVAGPVVCGDSPAVCDADWVDWLEEIPREGSAPPVGDDTGPGDDAGGDGDASQRPEARSASGCSAAHMAGSFGWLCMAALVWRRRNTTRGSLLRTRPRESTI